MSCEYELDNIFSEIQKDLSELKKSPDLPAKILLLKKRIEEAKEVYRHIPIRTKLKDHGEKLNRLISDFNWHPSRM